MDNQYQIIQEEPVDFVELAFGDTLWQKQVEVIESVRDNTYTSVRSCHDIGKSFIASRTALWFLHSFPNSKVITTAPTFVQVENILWREIRAAKQKARLLLGGKVNQTSIDISENWFAIGLSTNEPSRFQGYHAVNILLIADEAAGITEDIFEASEGIVSSQGARVLYIGNPTSLAGTFYKSFNLPNVKKIHISAFDTPNFTTFGITLDDIRNNTWEQKVTAPLPAPYLITPSWVADKYLRWGEGTPMWDSRVLGNFPQQGEDTLIPLIKIEEATRRELEIKPDDPEQIGADIARFGVDKTIFLHRKGGKTIEIQEYSHSDTMLTAQRLFDFSRFHPFGDLCVDLPGIGAGVVDRLRQLEDKREVFDVNVGLPSNDPERFVNLRAEYYWGLRERFYEGTIQIPPDDELMSQLSNLKFKYTTKGQIQIESKEEMKKRDLPSPDKADALMLAYAPMRKKPGLLEYMQAAKG